MYKIFILERDIPYTIYKNSNQVSLLLNNQKRKERKKNHAIIFRSNENWQPNETSSFFFIDRTHQLLISTASQQYRSIHPLFPSSPFKNRYRLRIITETTNHTQLLLLPLPSPSLLLFVTKKKRETNELRQGIRSNYPRIVPPSNVVPDPCNVVPRWHRGQRHERTNERAANTNGRRH